MRRPGRSFCCGSLARWSDVDNCEGTPKTTNDRTLGLADGKHRHSGKQFTRVLMSRVVQHLFGIAHFHKTPTMHHRDACRQLRDYRQTVRNENISQPELALQFPQEK